MATDYKVEDTDALLIIDVQYDFCPGGSLAVPDADTIISNINALSARFKHVILTQDWHPPGHKSFAAAHPGKNPLDEAELSHGTQVLWPDHCIQGTKGAEFHDALETNGAGMVIRKGMNLEIDSYSAFFENDRTTSTGLAGYLRALGVNRVFLCGIVAEYCVGFSGLDGRTEGFDVILIEDAIARFGGPDHDKMSEALTENGAQFSISAEVTAL